MIELCLRQASVKALQNMLQELETVQMFASKLQWPEPDFHRHLEMRISRLAADAIESFAKRYVIWLDIVMRKKCCEWYSM